MPAWQIHVIWPIVFWEEPFHKDHYRSDGLKHFLILFSSLPGEMIHFYQNFSIGWLNYELAVLLSNQQCSFCCCFFAWLYFGSIHSNQDAIVTNEGLGWHCRSKLY